MATEHAVAGRALGRREWHAASLPPLSAPRDFSAGQLLAPAAAAGALEVLDALDEPESDEPPLDEDELLDDEDELLALEEDAPPEPPSFLVEL